MTKAELINEMSIRTGFDKKTIAVIVESFMEEVKKSLVNGENVYLRGFGSFIVKTRKAKVARNILSSTSIAVPEHSIASFRAASELADAVYELKKSK